MIDWHKVEKCPHNDVTEHERLFSCGTPYCGGGSEYHCRDCGVFFTECACGFLNSMSGWSWRRWRSHDKKVGVTHD